MATRVEMNSPLTSRTTQAGLNDILNEVKLPRTHISPLSDASNKSSDSSSNSTLIIEETSRAPSKSVSMFNPGTRPRLSPKPFSKEKPPDFWESRKFMSARLYGLASKSAGDEKSPTDIPSETTTITSSSNLKIDDSERLKSYRITQETTKMEDDQNAKSVTSPATTGTRRFKSWVSGGSNVEESRSTSFVEDWKSSFKPEISSKPPILSKKPEVVQRKETFQATSPRTAHLDATDKQNESSLGGKKSSENIESEESSSVRVQLRPKRRPVSAIFLDSISDPAQDNLMIAEEKALPSPDKTWIRKPRPLSMDLTAKFENRNPLLHKKESGSEETKENIPLKKNSINTAILEEKAELGKKGEEGTSISGLNNINLGNDLRRRGISVTDIDSSSQDKDNQINIGTGKRYDRNQESKNICENQGLAWLSENVLNQTTKQLVQEEKSIRDDSNTNEEQNSDEIVITPGNVRRRISLLLANSGSSVEVTETPAAEEEKGNANIPQRFKGVISENVDIRTGRPRTSSQSRPLSSDLTKIFSSSPPPPPNVEMKPENTKEVQSVYVSQESKISKDQKSSELSDETPRTRTLFKKLDQPLESEDSADVSKERESYKFRNEKNDTETSSAEGMVKNTGPEDNEYKTVRATVFEHKVEYHSPAKIYSSKDQRSTLTTKNESISDNFIAKKGLGHWRDEMDDGILVNQQQRKDFTYLDFKKSGVHIGKSTPIENRRSQDNALQISEIQEHRNNKNVENNPVHQRIEARYEIFQTVGEKALSESIKVFPEDKAVTLRSRRSFHKKDWEENRPETDFSDRPLVKLQRSKSEYRKRDNNDATKERSYRDFDVQSLNKYDLRAEISAPKTEQTAHSYKAERFHPKENTTLVDDVKTQRIDTNQMYHRSDIVSLQERDYIRSVVHSPFGNTTGGHPIDGEDFRRSSQVSNRRSQMYQTSKSPAECAPEPIYKKEGSAASSLMEGEDTKRSNQSLNFKSQMYLGSRLPAEEPVQKLTTKDESTDIFKSMLNPEIEQMKKDLTTHSLAKDINQYETDTKLRETFNEEKDWMRERALPQSRHTDRIVDPLSNARVRTNDSLKFADDGTAMKSRDGGFRDKTQEPVNNFAARDVSPVDTKATYFAVTYIENKKEKTEKDFEKLSSPTNLTLNDDDLKHNENVPHESYVKVDLERSSALKQQKTSKSQNLLEDDITTVSGAKASQPFRRNVVDIDSLLKRSKQKPNIDDIRPSYKDPSVKTSQKAYEGESENVNKRDLNVFHDETKGAYKSKVVDIDSLMEEYKTQQKNDKLSGDTEYQGVSRWERPRSFRKYTESSLDSKWKDPSTKHFSSDEHRQYESPYTSLKMTSGQEVKTDILKSSQGKEVNQADEIVSVAEENYLRKDKMREYQGFHTTTEKNWTSTLESLVDSKQMNIPKKQPSYADHDSPETSAEGASPYAYSKTSLLTEMRFEYEQEKSVSKGVDPKVTLQTESKSSSTELMQLSYERKRPAKASDLISLMLEDKERRREEMRARKRIPEENVDYHRTPSNKRESSESEIFRRRSSRLQDTESLADSQRRNRNQHRERAVQPQQDQLKQCFTRNSQSNKDTDSLVQEQDRQYGTWTVEQQREDSFVQDSPSYDNISSRKQLPHSRLSSISQTETDQHDSITDPKDTSLDRSSMDLDSTDGTESTISFHDAKAQDFSFMDQTSVLDSTALKTRVQLSRRSQRRAPSQSQRKSRLLLSSSQLEVIEDTDSQWMYTDTTEEKLERKEDSDDDEKPQRSSVQPARIPMFPGMDPSALMGQLRKRQDQESSSDPPAQLSRSPKSPLPQGTIGVKLLPTPGDKQERGAESSPQWLKELKSKKRQSQYENPS